MTEVLTERHAQTLLVRLDRPHKHNALTQTMYLTLAQVLREAQLDDAVCAIVITGSQTCFTAGNDLRDFLQSPPDRLDAPAFQFMAAVMGLSKPLIAAVCGPAIGIGTTLLLHCDGVYITRDATLSVPFAKLGLTPEFGASLLLPRQVGDLLAAQLLLCGRTLNGTEAVEYRLANRVFDHGEECLQHALQQAAQLATLPQPGLRASKRLLRDAIAGLQAVFVNECEQFIERVMSAEARAAIQALVGPDKATR
ncbi:enoyl-CoA hydratase/isomerase [Pseudomonas sp. M47T1]|uniref:enoyl-CoA hydratase-related protein n=1 Tax=Pseudomonas sp. M47T1 TaxID=1179778 RepID=UPI000260808B|nr:enoyl-CoA hydratase-related protein [Pseudomonas sp. M47T1]EIK93746.1 enoyl-CoA hydratase/isomerase [Pseudomonas sp. M47T1]